MKNKIINNLNIYIKRIDESKFEDDYEKRYASLSKIVEEKTKKIDEKLSYITNRLFKIADTIFFYKELFVYKTYLLSKAVIHSIETENHISLANNTRSLLEQIAVYIYFIITIDKLLNELKNKNTYNAIDKIMIKTENIINRIYYGGNNDNEFKAIHINDVLKTSVSKLEDIIEVYNYLCEVVHPNYNNNLLVSSGKIREGKIGIKQSNIKIIDNIMKISNSLILYFNEETALKTPSLVWILHNYVEICLNNGAKVENIFSQKNSLPSGDGNTIQTAFFFKNARTSQESLALTYEYLDNQGYDIESIKREVVLNDESLKFIRKGFLIDKWITLSNKEIYFKTKEYKGI